MAHDIHVLFDGSIRRAEVAALRGNMSADSGAKAMRARVAFADLLEAGCADTGDREQHLRALALLVQSAREECVGFCMPWQREEMIDVSIMLISASDWLDQTLRALSAGDDLDWDTLAAFAVYTQALAYQELLGNSKTDDAVRIMRRAILVWHHAFAKGGPGSGQRAVGGEPAQDLYWITNRTMAVALTLVDDISRFSGDVATLGMFPPHVERDPYLEVVSRGGTLGHA